MVVWFFFFFKELLIFREGLRIIYQQNDGFLRFVLKK